MKVELKKIDVNVSCRLYMQCPICGKDAVMYDDEESFKLFSINCASCGWFSDLRMEPKNADNPVGHITVS